MGVVNLEKKMQYASLWVSNVWFGRNRHNYLNFSACSGLICFYLLVYLLPSEIIFSIYMEDFANSIPRICATFVLVLHWWPRHVKMLSWGGTNIHERKLQYIPAWIWFTWLKPNLCWAPFNPNLCLLWLYSQSHGSSFWSGSSLAWYARVFLEIKSVKF